MELDVKIEKKLRNFTLRADFTLRDEVFALLGASGDGKSMTLKCIAGLERPDKGRIVLDGRVLFDSDKGINLAPQQRRVGYLFQNFALFPNMTIADNIRFVAKGNRQEREQRVRENLARFDLTELGNAYPMELSGGQQQRAALARIFASDAQILLLDEPFSALDPYLPGQLALELREVLKAYGGAAVLVSHDRGEVYRLADRAAVIDRGQMQPVRTRDELFEHPDTLAATLLTGCKNVSAARKASSKRRTGSCPCTFRGRSATGLLTSACARISWSTAREKSAPKKIFSGWKSRTSLRIPSRISSWCAVPARRPAAYAGNFRKTSGTALKRRNSCCTSRRKNSC